MLRTRYSLVADIAEDLLTSHTIKEILPSSFLVNCLAVWAFCTELKVDVVLVFSKMLLLNFFSQMLRLQVTLLHFAVGSLKKVLLALGVMKADPAELVIALWALHLCTVSFLLLKSDAALNVWAAFGAIS